MTNLRGFVWSMGRTGTKVILETVNACTNAEQLSWIDTPRFIEAPDYYFQLYSRPFVLTLHSGQHINQYAAMLERYRKVPVVYAVRDPVPHIKSYARVFLNSYIGRRIDDVVAHVKSGKSVVGTINLKLFDDAQLAQFDYGRHWSAIKSSPHKIVDMSDLGEETFVQTLTEICDMFGLPRTKPIAWPGIANSTTDSFILNYRRTFPVLGRKLELRFTRWRDLWAEPGLVTVAVLRSPQLDPLVEPGGSLYVQMKTEHLLSYGRIERERDAFALLFSDQGMREDFAAVIAEDYEIVSGLVEKELGALQKMLTERFERSCREGVERFLTEHPALRQKWSGSAVAQQAA
jgi:hypothetical protein